VADGTRHVLLWENMFFCGRLSQANGIFEHSVISASFNPEASPLILNQIGKESSHRLLRSDSGFSPSFISFGLFNCFPELQQFASSSPSNRCKNFFPVSVDSLFLATN
jgi:hypothetical protein